MNDILEQILRDKRVEVAGRKIAAPEGGLRDVALSREAPPEFARALRAVRMGLIAEVKRQSPSAGLIRDPFDPAEIAEAYEDAGAQAISVLMDKKYFGGGEADFRAVRSAVALPLLYKEFVVDPWQVWHASALGASAVLLIAAALDHASLRALFECCAEARVEALVEVHNEEDMAKIAGLPVRCVGVNNRDLRTFTVALETTLRLRDMAPEGALLVSESGIRTAEDVVRLHNGGVDAILVGESLLRHADPGAAVSALMAGVWEDGAE